jgi:hypothetical protein
MPGLTIADLVRNGTMSDEIAATLWAAVDNGASFLMVALPRFAGKSTTSAAVLEMRPSGVPLHYVEGGQAEMERLKQAAAGGYLVVAEFSTAPVPGYIWGAPVRRVFDTLEAGYALQSCLHARSAAEGILEVTLGNGVPDHQAAKIALVVYISLFGTSMRDLWRRVTDVYEVEAVEGGRPRGRSLFRWRPGEDDFEGLDLPRRFSLSATELAARAGVLGDLAGRGRTSPADVATAVAAFRDG